jgi:urease accessory protein
MGDTLMASNLTQLTLLSWLSPAFPTGGFAYSAGLESAAHKSVQSADDLQAWLTGHIENGPLWNDAVLLFAAWRRGHDNEALVELAELARALAVSAERMVEIETQGISFAAAASAWLAEPLPQELPYVIALGAAARRVGVDAEQTIAAFLHAFVVNQCQAAIRLSLIGQTQAAAIMAALTPLIAKAAQGAAVSTLDDLGSSGILADIAALTHETMETRLFRS